MEKNKYGYWLCNLPGIGDKTIQKILKGEQEAEVIYRDFGDTSMKAQDRLKQKYRGILTENQVNTLQVHTRQWQVDKEYESLLQRGIGFLTIQDETYPWRLKKIPDPPYGIYVKGKVPQNHIMSVAVIGARECSEYGRYVGKELGRVLGENGVQVISGMARGIDGISQEAALEAGGASFGVLGCGVDICYPALNRGLYDRLLVQGGILSAYPPGTRPRASLFPPRNRIVSGLADVVIVVEARQKSGTLITVDMALEQGREVYVVPGRLTDRLSDGCNKLIKQGAGILLSPEEFLGEMQTLFPGKIPGRSKGPEAGRNPLPGTREDAGQTTMDSKEKWVYDCLDLTPKSIEQIRESLEKSEKHKGKAAEELTYFQLQQILMKLCLMRKIKQASHGFYCKEKPV